MSNCKGCGGCCSTLLPCSKNEVKTIRHYIKRHTYPSGVIYRIEFSKEELNDQA